MLTPSQLEPEDRRLILVSVLIAGLTTLVTGVVELGLGAAKKHLKRRAAKSVAPSAE